MTSPSYRLTRRDAIRGFAALAAVTVVASCGGAETAPPSTASAANGGQTWPLEKAAVSASLPSVNHMWAQWGVLQGICMKHFLDVEVTVNIAERMPLAAAEAAHDKSRTGRMTGKIVLLAR